MHQCIWTKFRKRLHFIRNSGLKNVRIAVYFFWHFLTDTCQGIIKNLEVEKFCPKFPDKRSAGLTRFDCYNNKIQKKKFFLTWFDLYTKICTFWYINQPMLKNFFFEFLVKFFLPKKFFFGLIYSIYISKCAESNSKRLLEWMLVSLTFLKKVTWENTYFKKKKRKTVISFLK